jgi:hypothetical protein
VEETLGNETTGRWKRRARSFFVFRARPFFVFVMWGLGSLIVLILVASAFWFTLYASISARAILAKAEADVRALSSAIEIYKAHMGTLPADLTALTAPAINGLNQSAGPFMGSIPLRSRGFSEYQYERYPDNQWRIFTSGRDFCGDAQRIEASAGSPPAANPLSCWTPLRFWWLVFFPEKGEETFYWPH